LVIQGTHRCSKALDRTYESPRTEGTVAWCLELHDLWISKAVAGRPKDLEFCRALLRRGLVDSGILEQRLASDDRLGQTVRSAVSNLIK
jgi:hypothetical protein